MPKRKATKEVQSPSDSKEQVQSQVGLTQNPAADSPHPDAGESTPPREYKSPAAQEVITHLAGVHLSNDRKRGVFTLRLDPPMPRDELAKFVSEKLLPILHEQHQLKDGPTVRFHEQPDGSFEIRYRFRERDEDGQPLLDADGTKKWLLYHNQVSLIAYRVADQAGNLLAEKLGIANSPAIPF